MNAVYAVEILRKRELHENERPIALMMLQTAEMNRDRKKNKKANTFEQFCLYSEREDENSPEARYGAAAMALIAMNTYPGWALFIYDDLKKKAQNVAPPPLLAYICEDAMILAPEMTSEGCKGMLIACRSAGGNIRLMKSETGATARVVIPPINASVYADEEAILDVISSSS